MWSDLLALLAIIVILLVIVGTPVLIVLALLKYLLGQKRRYITPKKALFQPGNVRCFTCEFRDGCLNDPQLPDYCPIQKGGD